MAEGRQKPVECPYNEGFLCAHTADCEKCGWNPDVEARRTEALCKEFGIEAFETRYLGKWVGIKEE